jgi:hypothetical protein
VQNNALVGQPAWNQRQDKLIYIAKPTATPVKNYFQSEEEDEPNLNFKRYE